MKQFDLIANWKFSILIFPVAVVWKLLTIDILLIFNFVVKKFVKIHDTLPNNSVNGMCGLKNFNRWKNAMIKSQFFCLLFSSNAKNLIRKFSSTFHDSSLAYDLFDPSQIMVSTSFFSSTPSAVTQKKTNFSTNFTLEYFCLRKNFASLAVKTTKKAANEREKGVRRGKKVNKDLKFFPLLFPWG